LKTLLSRTIIKNACIHAQTKLLVTTKVTQNSNIELKLVLHITVRSRNGFFRISAIQVASFSNPPSRWDPIYVSRGIAICRCGVYV
jgi:hypothetical protein